jgi:ATP-independent RNA helicase DbpA
VEKYLSNLGISALNPMQLETINKSNQSDNLIVLSPTGSGKTLAFLLPLVEKLNSKSYKLQAVIIAPSRELAQQIEGVFKKMQTGFNSACFYGGHDYKTEINALKGNPAVLIGTPGRLVDHLNKGNIDLYSIETLICDEFDKSLEFGFEPDIKCLVRELETLKSTILTSATQAIEVPGFIPFENSTKIDYLHTFQASKYDIQIVRSPENDKAETLLQLICELNNESTLVFCNHRDAVERIGELLESSRVDFAKYHGGLKQDEREKSLFKLKSGSVNTLLCTDLGSRGLDIEGIKNVIHYQIPTSEDAYIHRNGRTARVDESGAVFFVLSAKEYLPTFVDSTKVTVKKLSDEYFIPDLPEWDTIFINAGKKHKLSKVDIVGSFIKEGGLNKDELGLIEVKDYATLVAVKGNKANQLAKKLNGSIIKKKKVFIAVAR